MVYSGNDGEVEQLKKRVRRGKIEAQKKMEREEGVAMEVTEEEHRPGTGPRPSRSLKTRRPSRESNNSSWDAPPTFFVFCRV